jgi:hypothetical protein
MKKQAGWTLVEIAIVMVVVGLLLGAVMKGQEIITNAKIKKIENDYNGVKVAIYLYQSRYLALPGDDLRAQTRWFEGGVKSGDGNRFINGTFDSAEDTDESRLFWSHLRCAGLIAGEKTSTDLPIHAFQGVMGVSSETWGRDSLAVVGTFVGFANISNKVALILESRSDDNDPYRGMIETDAMEGYDNPATIHNLYFGL